MLTDACLKRTTALVLVICLLFLLRIPLQPMAAAAPTAEKNDNPEQGWLEIREDQAPVNYSRRSFTPILIGLLVAGAAAAVLFLIVLKNYDITGSWIVHYKWSSMNDYAFIEITFSGKSSSGTFVDIHGRDGRYQVNGKKVEFNYNGGSRFTGTLSDKNNMSGSMSAGDMYGVWHARRAGL